MCVKMTDLNVLKVLLANGATMRKRDGEYRVTLSDPELDRTQLEDMASYTPDLDDALGTGLAMAAWWAVRKAEAIQGVIDGRKAVAP